MPTEPTPRAALGRALRTLRFEAGLTQEDVSAGAGLHVTYLSGIENGHRNPSFESIDRILRALGADWGRLASELQRAHKQDQ